MRHLVLAIGLLVSFSSLAWGQEPETSAFYRERATALWHQANYEGAIASYTRAIEIDEASRKTRQASETDLNLLAGAYTSRAQVRRMLGNFDGALADNDKSIELRPQLAEAFYQRGVTHKMAGDPRSAVSDYTEAIRLDSRFARAYIARGFARNELNDAAGSLKDYDVGIELDPKDAQAYFFRGVSRANSHDYAGALNDYGKIIEINPRDPMGYRLRGLMFLVLGRDSEAEKDLREYLRLDPAGKVELEKLVNQIKAHRKADSW
jgi:tetratricopeptide (TPR) repeat protein